MNMVSKAITIAIESHEGQIDKSGKPYILHPLYLMSKMTTEDEMVVAVLHDVVEDSQKTHEDLTKVGFSKDSLDALELLTRTKDTPYEEYIDAVAKNPLARKVKLADLSHNMDITRLSEITIKDLERLEKYRKAYARLSFNTAPQV